MPASEATARFVRRLDGVRHWQAGDRDLIARFCAWIEDAAFPCVGAKSALGSGLIHFCVADDIASGWDDMRIYDAVARFAVLDAQRDDDRLASCVILFRDNAVRSEAEFEALLWSRLQSLSDKDEWCGHDQAKGTTDDPARPDFALSFAGRALFAVGLHPGARRRARAAPMTAVVLNLHDQFSMLRASGRYEKMRAAIIARDVAYSGSENPMLARHGSVSEARQYSGREVADDWKCPFAGRGGAGIADAA